MSAKGNVYRLKNGKTPQSWGLKQAEVGISTPDGFKFINYFPGSSSIFVDDKDNEKRKPEQITFEFNESDATEIYVPIENVILNKYLQAHPWFNVHFELFSEYISAERKLAEFEMKEKALMLIKETGDVRIQATTMAINGMESFGWEPLTCKAWLKEKALTDPNTIIKRMEGPGYESRFTAALAFYSGIVKEDAHASKVVWNDETQGTILHLAKGEIGITKLGEMLAVNDNESRLVLQEIGKRVDIAQNRKADSANATPNNAEMIAANKRIAELEAQLAAKNTVSEVAPAKEVKEEKKEEAPKGEPTIEELRDAYVEKFKKEVPPPMKNNLAWLQDKLKG